VSSIHGGWEIVHSGVDWLAASCHDPSRLAWLMEWARQRQSQLEEAGNAVKPWSGHGYEGRSVGQVAFAFNGREAICQLSGAEAYASWRTVAENSTNISRIDLASTVRAASRTDALARQGYCDARGARRGRGRPAQLSLLVNEDRGDTLYIGAPASDQRGRLYDKDRESGEDQWKRCWRYEVQFRRLQAKAAALAVAAAPVEADKTAAVVVDWFRSRGVEPPVSLAGGGGYEAPGARQSDDERWLAWVRKCVQPRARKLAVRYGYRYVTEACVGRITSLEEWESMLRDWEAPEE
jgi:hypothetical protein